MYSATITYKNSVFPQGDGETRTVTLTDTYAECARRISEIGRLPECEVISVALVKAFHA